MAIIVNLDVEMAKNKMSLTELAEKVGISMTNLSLLKTGKVKGIRFNTLEAICRELKCKPGDILDVTSEQCLNLPKVLKLLAGLSKAFMSSVFSFLRQETEYY